MIKVTAMRLDWKVMIKKKWKKKKRTKRIKSANKSATVYARRNTRVWTRLFATDVRTSITCNVPATKRQRTPSRTAKTAANRSRSFASSVDETRSSLRSMKVSLKRVVDGIRIAKRRWAMRMKIMNRVAMMSFFCLNMRELQRPSHRWLGNRGLFRQRRENRLRRVLIGYMMCLSTFRYYWQNSNNKMSKKIFKVFLRFAIKHFKY